jgi:hypothetical protein
VPFRSLTIRRPTAGTTPEKGDEMTRNGDTWIIEAVTELKSGVTVINLSPVEPSEAPSIEEDGTGTR